MKPRRKPGLVLFLRRFRSRTQSEMRDFLKRPNVSAIPALIAGVERSMVSSNPWLSRGGMSNEPDIDKALEQLWNALVVAADQRYKDKDWQRVGRRKRIALLIRLLAEVLSEDPDD